MIPWLIDISLALMATAFSLLSLRNYLAIRGTSIGRYMLSIAVSLALVSTASAVSFAFWMLRGHGADVALPSMILSALLAASSFVLYKISSI